MTYRLFYRDTKPMQDVIISQGHPNAKELHARWLFNEGGGTLVRDVSGHGCDLTLVNITSADWTFDRLGHAVRFIAANEANAGSAREAGYQHRVFTLSVWIRMVTLPAPGGVMAIMDTLGFGGPYGFHLGVHNTADTGNVPAFLFGCPVSNVGVFLATAVTPQIATGILYHVVAVRTYDATKIYLNGILWDTDLYTGWTSTPGLLTRIGMRYFTAVPQWMLDAIISDAAINDYPFNDQNVLEAYEEPYGIFIKNPTINIP